MNYRIFAFGHKGLIPVFEARKNNNSLRIVDPNNDIYPAPLMSQSPSCKREGYDKLFFAVINLQPNRVKDIIANHQDDYKLIKPEDLSQYVSAEEAKEILATHNYPNYYTILDISKTQGKELIDIYAKDGPYGNILNRICSGSLVNIPCDGNEYLFDRLFITIIRTLKPENIPHMINVNMFHNDTWNHICDQSYLYGLVMLNYGAKFSDGEREKFIANLADDYMKAFYKSHQVDRVLNSKLPIGQKLKELVDTCPITLEPIKHPVIIEDGSVYEKDSITEWFDQGNDTSPVTGAKLKKFWIMYDIDNNEIIYGKNGSLFPKEVKFYVK